MSDGFRAERPGPGGNPRMGWVSDVAARMLREMGIRYIAQNPGSSFGGLHDSIVNFLGNRDPTMLLCLNENQAVAIAHGYAKVAGEPMGVILHSNVGLMAGIMSIYNAWCDRVPMFIMGASGPADATRRTPWIHWIHTARDQAAMIRHFSKWDDSPASAPAMIESMLRANILSSTAPKGPTYVCLDVALQQSELVEPIEIPDVARFAVPPSPEPSAEAIEAAADLLVGARDPVIMAGRVSRRGDDWERRVRLAEALGAAVVTDLKAGAAFPTDHPLHVGLPGYHFREPQQAAVAAADVVLGLDWMDFGSILDVCYKGGPVTARIIQCSADSYVHNGWSMDHYSLPPADVSILAEPEAAVRRLLEAVERRLDGRPAKWDGAPKERRRPDPGRLRDRDPGAAVSLVDLGLALDAARRRRELCLARVPLGWASEAYQFRHPLDYLGGDGGAGVGAGPGNTVGAALALMGSGRTVVSVIGDGDLMQGVTALWTAAHYRIPALIIVVNNRSHLNDELIQEKIAAARGRSPENSWVGQRIVDPPLDLPAIARAQGVAAEGPVETVGELPAALERALAVVEAGEPCLLDVVIMQRQSAASFAERGTEAAGEDRR